MPGGVIARRLGAVKVGAVARVPLGQCVGGGRFRGPREVRRWAAWRVRATGGFGESSRSAGQGSNKADKLAVAPYVKRRRFVKRRLFRRKVDVGIGFPRPASGRMAAGDVTVNCLLTATDPSCCCCLRWLFAVSALGCISRAASPPF